MFNLKKNDVTKLISDYRKEILRTQQLEKTLCLIVSLLEKELDVNPQNFVDDETLA